MGFAQEKVDWLNEKSAVILSDSTNNLTGITVTATRKNTANWSVPYSVSVVNKSQLAAFGFRSTPEALSGTAGVFVQKTNHGGGSPFIRGLTGNQTLLLMDGIRLNNATYRYGPNQYLNTINSPIIPVNERLNTIKIPKDIDTKNLSSENNQTIHTIKNLHQNFAYVNHFNTQRISKIEQAIAITGLNFKQHIDANRKVKKYSKNNKCLKL